jgi:hypothetical protein
MRLGSAKPRGHSSCWTISSMNSATCFSGNHSNGNRGNTNAYLGAYGRNVLLSSARTVACPETDAPSFESSRLALGQAERPVEAHLAKATRGSGTKGATKSWERAKEALSSKSNRLARLEKGSDQMARITASTFFTVVVMAIGVVPACSSSPTISADGGADRTPGLDSGQGGQTSGGSGGRAGGMGGMGAMGGRPGTACTPTGGCRNGMICDTANNTCVECLSTADCGTQKCDLSSHTCVDCLTSTDCPAGMPVCSSGRTCGATCTTSANCPQGLPICETATHACVECLIGSDCGAGGVCQSDLTCG